MGSIYRRNILKPIPAGAELVTKRGKRFARWTDRRGKIRTAEIRVTQDGGERIIIRSKYLAKYRDGENIVREVATGCDDETAARSVLADLERRAELVKSKVMTAAENAVSDHADRKLSEHFDAYMTTLEADGTSPRHRANVRAALKRIAADCRFATLADISRDAFEKWLNERAREDMSARTRNIHRSAIVAFCNWGIVTRRLAFNPLAAIRRANEDADKRHQRRALTEAELSRLMHAARVRPLAELGRDTVEVAPNPDKPKRANWKWVKLTPETLDAAEAKAREQLADKPERIAELEAVGNERAMIYKTLALTGLRLGELTSITVGQIHFDAPTPFIELHAADEKARRGAEIPLQRDLAANLRNWTAAKLEQLRDDCRRRIGPDGAPALPLRLPPDTRLFDIPSGLSRIFNRDIDAAGIVKTDERGRVVDVHALRHTFGTLLSKSGTAPRTAQAAMRHGSIDLTMNVYTDPRMLDIASAIESLPTLPLRTSPHRESQRATGTLGDADATDDAARTFPPPFPPKRGKSCNPTSSPDKTSAVDDDRGANVKGRADKGLRHAGNDCQKAGDATRTRNIQLGRLRGWLRKY